FLGVLNGCLWPFSADHGYKACWSNPMQSVVRTNANDWSGRMQGVVKWSAISQSSDMVASPVLVEIVAATKKMARMRAGQMGILQRSRVNLRSTM
ncbi:hypothetical protein, partial [Pseudomonas sp. ACN8]|uniref:hypothetical protein n=1 Tax=Pseudomonas sp. ACN8 TaxID=1920428 RepID=UPI001C45493E